MVLSQARRARALEKELAAVAKQEQRLARAALAARPAGWKQLLEMKIPDKVYGGLESAFCKGFSLIFQRGRGVIERGFDRENVKADYAIRDKAVELKGGRRELKQMARGAGRSDLFNLAITTAEGLGLGALGIGMPDIVLFLGNLLKGIYATALSYGFDYDSPQEQLLILQMMEASLSTGEDWVRCNDATDQMLEYQTQGITQEDIQAQIARTSQVFAVDMLVLKFIQGLPVVGILGGAANPVYYRKVMKYVQLKYRKRYLLGKRGDRGI